MKKRIAMYWLIPSAAENELFRAVIRILATEFKSAKFEAHLTLCQAERKSAKTLLRRVKLGPIRLRIRGVAQSPKFTKTLYVRCTPTPSLKKVISQLGGDPAALKDPHVSLLYKKLPLAVRRELTVYIKLPFREINFDRIKVVSCITPTQTPKDVESWRVLGSKKLSG